MSEVAVRVAGVCVPQGPAAGDLHPRHGPVQLLLPLTPGLLQQVQTDRQTDLSKLGPHKSFLCRRQIGRSK